MMLLEVCVDDAAGLASAIVGGADRIELCSALELGGLTPTPGLMALAARAPITVRAMVRPRPGDFVFGAADVEAMLGDIAAIRAAGLSGVVLGASLPDGRLDTETLHILMRAATGLGATLHRAVDLVPEMAEAIEQAVGLGFDTVLTSGGASNVIDGAETIALAHRIADGRLTIMAGTGVNESSAAQLLVRVKLDALHGSCSEPAPVASAAASRLGFDSPGRRSTSAAKVAALKAVMVRSQTGRR
ncbi:copper homeostasis protein [Devosia psychrophila]|jgi:copper homeostasis protein|uniref:PF03932 family protein CutC n=3 Tax=Devosia psychrophila TaxID=728005 RepID=A0A1I1L173_9HYPH|nr:copper homeostasis protein [Devosia psychrophila]